MKDVVITGDGLVKPGSDLHRHACELCTRVNSKTSGENDQNTYLGGFNHRRSVFDEVREGTHEWCTRRGPD